MGDKTAKRTPEKARQRTHTTPNVGTIIATAHSQQTHVVVWEYVPASLSPHFIQQLPTPPPVCRRIRDSNDIPCLKIKLFIDRRRVVIQRFDCQPEPPYDIGIDSERASA